MTRAELRAAMPLCTQFIDRIRKEFNDSIIAIKAKENDNEIVWRKGNGVQGKGKVTQEKVG